MSNENELLEPLATEAGQQAIARAINNLGSLENAVRAERAAATATQKADEARNSAEDASDYATEARNWANKTDGYVAQETITIPPEQEGDEPTTETIDLYSARYYAALAQDAYNNLQFDTEPTENSTALVSSGAIYTALNGKADKSDTYTKTEVDTALSNVQGQLTFDNVPTANSDNPVKSSGIKTALDGKQDTLTFDSTPTANSTNPVTSGGVYTALQNVNIDIDDEITEDSDNPVTSAAIYEVLQNFTPSGGGDTYNGDVFVSGTYIDTNNLIQNIYNRESSWDQTAGIKVEYTATQDCFVCGYLANGTGNTVNKENCGINVYINDVFIQNITHSSNSHSVAAPINLPLKKGDVFKVRMLDASIKGYLNVFGIKHGDVVSEQMYSNVLYENSSGWSSGNITLNDSLENYDFIEIAFGESNYNTQRYSAMFSKTTLSGYIGSNKGVVINGAGAPFFIFTIPSATQFNYSNKNSLVVYKIVGYKLAKGGYSGIVSDARMTVKSGTVIDNDNITDNKSYSVTFDSPMPDTNYIVSVTISGGGAYSTFPVITYSNKTVNGFLIYLRKPKYPVGDTYTISGITIDWIAIRPNSYTREGMVEDVLYTTPTGFTTGTINLSGNISDYDLIEFVIGDSIDGEKFTNNRVYSSSVLTNIMGQQNKFFHLAYYSGGWQMLSVDSDNKLSCSNRSGNTVLYKITGIKFGRYVSGVAVDTTITSSGTGVPSTNAVYQALQNIPSGGGGGGSITIDSTPTENSNNAVSSGGVYDAIKYGLPVAFEDLVPSDYKLQTADEWIYSQNGRSYYKKNNGIAAGAIINTNRNTHAILVSDNSNSVVTYSSYNTSDDSDVYTLTFNGKTYYYSMSEYGWDRGSMDVPQSDASVKTLTTFSSNQVAAQYIIENVLTEDKTLNDYHITDAYTKTEVDTLIQNAGGGSSITVDSTITQNSTNPVEGGAIYTALGDKADKSTTYTKTEVDTALGSKQGTLTFDTTPTENSTNPVTSGGVYTALQNLPTGTGDVTTNTDQNITGTKTFVGSKKVGFKQSAANDKLGFTLFGNTGTERGYLEFNPTNTVDGVTGLMTLGNYATSAAGLTQVGFRRYSNISGQSGAYNLLMPMVADARTPFSLTTSYQNFYLPLGFTDGTTTVKTAKSGLVDLSPLLASLEARIAALEGN